MGLATIVGKLSAFLAQWALGWLLAKDDFQLYALAISVTTLVSVLLGGGTQRVLIQQPKRFKELAWPIYLIAQGFNFAATAILLVMAPVAAWYYRQPDVAPLLAVIALSIPLGTPSMVRRAKLSIDLRFRDLAAVDGGSGILRQASIVLFALAGCGPYSFALPATVVALFEWLVLYRLAGPLPREGQLTRALFREVFAGSRWIMLSSLFISTSLLGDYMVVGRLAKPLLADYFFGYQLSASVIVLFSSALLGVLMPTLTRLADDPQRQSQAYLRAARILVFAAAPMFVGLAVVAEPLVHVLWKGKWDAAIPVVQIMSVAMTGMVLSPLGHALIEARGRWVIRATLLGLHGATTLVAAWLGCQQGTLEALAFWVGGQHVLNGLLQGLVAARLTGAGAGAFLRALVPGVAVCLPVGLACSLFLGDVPGVTNPWLRVVVPGAAFTLVVGVLYLTLTRAALEDVLRVVSRPGKRRPGPG